MIQPLGIITYRLTEGRIYRKYITTLTRRLPTTNEYNILVHFFIENQQYYLNRICFRVKKMLHLVDWLKGSLNAEKYCRVQLLIIQKGVDEDEISVSIRGEISFDSYLRCFQENTVGLMRSGTYEIEAVSLTMY